jgi:hypothetical protein
MVRGKAYSADEDRSGERGEMTDMPFHHLDRIAASDDATKAIFEHVQYVLTAAAVGAAGTWLGAHGSISSLHGFLNHVEGFVLAMFSFCLLWIAITNARVRLARAGISGRWIAVMWVTYSAFAIGGLVTYAAH